MTFALFASCETECEHEWQDATCTTLKTCSLCGITEGELIEHTWVDATCIAPKTCSTCGKTEGSVSLIHNFIGDKCSDCNTIKLTLNNYEDYIECNATVKAGDSLYISSTRGYVYTSAKCSFEAIGNSHYKYQDVYITIKFSHYDRAGYKLYLENNISSLLGQPIEEEAIPYDDATYTVKLSLAGNGSQTCNLNTPWSSERTDYAEIDTIFDRTYYEIVSITGTVVEY